MVPPSEFNPNVVNSFAFLLSALSLYLSYATSQTFSHQIHQSQNNRAPMTRLWIKNCLTQSPICCHEAHARVRKRVSRYRI